MKPTIIITVIAVLATALFGMLIFAPSALALGKPEAAHSFSVLEMGRAGEYGYAVINYQGAAHVRLLGYNAAPYRKIVILNDSSGIGMARMPEFIAEVGSLERYGYEVKVSNVKALENTLYIIPTGAMPSYVLDNLVYNTTNAHIIYLGKNDLVLYSDGIRQQAWYHSLSPKQRARVVQMDILLDQMLEGGMPAFLDELLENKWAVIGSSNYSLEAGGRETLSVALGNGTVVRLIYEQKNASLGFIDSKPLHGEKSIVTAANSSIFQWEKTTVIFRIPKTNGTAIMRIYLNSKQLNEEVLQRVADMNVFVKILSFPEPGNYIIRVEDNSGAVASGMVHVKHLDVSFMNSIGTSYYFNVTIDGKPVSSEKAEVSLGNSTEKKNYYVSDGVLTVRAQLKKGTNVFNIGIFSTTVHASVENNAEGIVDVYLKWGIPALAFALFAYFWARLAKRPSYILRMGEAAQEIRKEVRLSTVQALKAFTRIREDMQLGRSPITTSEYSVALKRYATDGADVTEGNVEELLKHLVKQNRLVSHKRYFQPSGEGDVKRNTLMRQIREALIQSGMSFTAHSDRFATKDFEIGPYGARFTKKTVVVLDENKDLDRILSAMDERARAMLRLKEKNGLIEFIRVDKLSERL